MDANGVTFEVESQTGAAITNIGGDQTVYAADEESTARRTARLVAAGGLATLFAGLGLLVLTIVKTVHAILPMPPWPHAPYTQYVAATWLPAVILLAVGGVLTRFGRLFANR